MAYPFDSRRPAREIDVSTRVIGQSDAMRKDSSRVLTAGKQYRRCANPRSKWVFEISYGGAVERIDADHIRDVGGDGLSARFALAHHTIMNEEPVLETVAPAAGKVQKLTDKGSASSSSTQ